MVKLEKIREFLYDLDKIRSDSDAVHNLITKYMGVSKEESEGLRLKIEIGEVCHSDEELKLWIIMDGCSESVWFPLRDSNDRHRLENKEGNIIVETKI